MLRAALNLDRFAIVYELAKEYVDKAIKRFGLTTLYEEGKTFEETGQQEKAVRCEPEKCREEAEKLFRIGSDGQMAFAV